MHLRRAEYRFHQEHDAFHLLQFDNRLCFVLYRRHHIAIKIANICLYLRQRLFRKGIFCTRGHRFVNPAAVRTGTASLCCRSVTYTIFPCSFQF